MRRNCICILVWLNVLCASSQNFTTREHNFMMPLIYNPAVAGTEEEAVALLSAKRSWIGVKNGPAMNLLSAHAKASDLGFSRPKKYISNGSELMGIGMSIYNDRNGPLSANGLQLAYAYHVSLSGDKLLSFGLSAKLTQYMLDETVFKATDPDDPNISYNRQSTLMPDVNAGVLLHHRDFYAGLSATNLGGFRRRALNFVNEDNLRTLYLTAGYKFTLPNDKVLQTTVLTRYSGNRLWLDIMARYHYRKFLWYGAGYATPGTWSGFGAIRVRKMDFGYVYEYYNSPLYNYSRGNHMIFIGYNL